MEKKGTRLFQPRDTSLERNIVELDSRRQLRLKVNELIRLVNDPTITTGEIQEYLSHGAAMYGRLFAAQLVRCLHCDDPQERQLVVWLLTILNDEAAIPLLLCLSRDIQAPRPVRLSASLALAGMGVTPALIEAADRRSRLYAIS